MVRNSSRWNFFTSSFDLEPVKKKPTSRSFRSEVSTYGLARPCDGDNRRTRQIMVCCFSLENVVYPYGMLGLNRNGMKDGGQQ